MNQPYDIAVIGGGLVGLGTALGLLARPDRPRRLVVLEAEPEVAAHQSGHNSGVIHAGLYYKPGSLKATLCAAGREEMFEFCARHGVRHERCGKLVVATEAAEVPKLDELERRGAANGIEGIRRLGAGEIREREPHCAGVAGLLIGATGIADYPAVARAMVGEIATAGGEVRTGAGVRRARRVGGQWVLGTDAGEVRCTAAVNCAGVYSDRIARLFGVRSPVRIVPFRGEYHELRPDRRFLVRHLIYPVPNPELPFLGVHFTRRVDGTIEAGPNAVLALARHGYSWGRVSLSEAARLAIDPAVWKMGRRFWRVGIMEVRRSLSRARLAADLRKLIPEVREGDLVPAGSGVRAQAVDDEGRLVDDFRIEYLEGSVHVLNAPSPGATASLAIGRAIAERVAGAGASAVS
ncbi:MAG: L-2-hydroxyglutarate oxidase [Phycisphaerales bacterium]